MMKQLARIDIRDEGLWADHNMPCSVCGIRHAVLFLNSGVFEPCWECQDRGWRLRRKGKWWHRASRYGS